MILSRHDSVASSFSFVSFCSKSFWLRFAALGVLCLFAANQLKFLSMSMLHKNTGFFNRGQSGPIKPNQVIF